MSKVSGLFGYNSELLASCSWDSTVTMIDLESGKSAFSGKGHDSGVRDVDGIRNGKFMVSAGDTSAAVWDVNRGRVVQSLRCHGGYVTSVAVHPEGDVIGISSTDGAVSLWSVRMWKPLFKCVGHNGPVWVARFNTATKHLLTGSTDRTIRAWDMRAGDHVLTFKGHGDAIRALAVSPVHDFMFSGGSEANAFLWRLGPDIPAPVPGLGEEAVPISYASFSDSSRFFLTCSSSSGICRMYYKRRKRVHGVFRESKEGVFSSIFCANDRLIAVGDGEGSIRMYENPAQEILEYLNGVDGEAVAMDEVEQMRRVAREKEAAMEREIEDQKAKELEDHMQNHATPTSETLVG